MFMCRKCLVENYEMPKWEDTYSRSFGPCEFCHKSNLCIDIPHQYFVVKGQHTTWECANKANVFKDDHTCGCNTIKPGDEVIEITKDANGGIRFQITNPDPKAARPMYARSFRCAATILKVFLRERAAKGVLDNLPKLSPNGVPL